MARNRGSRRTLAGIALALTLLAATGCGDDGGGSEEATTTDAAATGDTGETGNTTDETDETTGTDDTTGTDETGDTGVPAAVDGPLLTVDDLPDGWTETGADDGVAFDPLPDPDEAAEEEADEECPSSPVPDVETESIARVRFEESERHVLLHGVVAAPDAADAEALFAYMSTSLGCTPAGPVEPTLLDGVGDEAFTAVVPGPFAISLGGVRVGSTVAFVTGFGSSDGSTDDLDLVTGLVEAMAERAGG